jgi:hypothetical protein
MATPVRPVRVKQAFWGYAVGHIIPEAAPGLAQDLIDRNLCEYADQPVNGYVHRMMEPIKRKRGRPRKEQ